MQKLWDSGWLLAARLNGEPLSPHALRLKQPTPRELTERFGEVQDWLRVQEPADQRFTGRLNRLTADSCEHVMSG